MNARRTPTFAIRATSLLASAAITALIVGSQLGIANGYTQEADALLAASNAQPPVAQGAAAFPQTMQATPGLCLYDELGKLPEGFHGRPEQHRRADTPCQCG